MARDEADRDGPNDPAAGASLDPFLDLRGSDGHRIEVLGDVMTVLTPAEERHYGLRSGVRAKVQAIKPSGIDGQPYIEVMLLDGSGRTPTFYPSMVKAALDKVRWHAPDPASSAAPQARALAEVSDQDPDFQEQLNLLYPTLSAKDRRKTFKAQKKYGALGVNATHGQDGGATVRNVSLNEQVGSQPSAVNAQFAAQATTEVDANAGATTEQRWAYLGPTRKGDPDFANKLEALYQSRKPKDREKAFNDEFKRYLRGVPMVPDFPRVGEWMLHGDDRMDEILMELRPGEIPLLGGGGALVIEKTSVGTAGKASDWTVQGGSFLITDERFTLNTRLFLSRNRREVQLADVQSIDVSTVGGLFNRITVRTPGGPVMMDIQRNKREAELIRRTLQEAADAARLKRHQNLQAVPTVVQVQDSPFPLGPTAPSKASQLKELFELHQVGAISAAEYESMKAQIIGQDAPD